MRKKCFLLTTVLAFSLFIATSASAFLLTTSENPAIGFAPYYATVDVTVAGDGDSASFVATAYPGYGFIQSVFALNVKSAFTVGSVSYTPDSPAQTIETLTVPPSSNLQMDGMGDYNLLFSIGSSNQPLSTISFTLTNTSGVDWVDVMSVLTENNKGYLAAAHIKLLDGSDFTGYVAGNDVSIPNVPIPAAAWLLGSGLLGLVLVRRRMKK